MIFVDTSAWYAMAVRGSPEHLAAVAWLGRNTETLFTTDYVLDELLTLLRSRGLNHIAVDIGGQLIGDTGLSQFHIVSETDVISAWSAFRDYSDKEWSFTDCVSKVVMESLGITHAFAFDHHFRQFGTVTVVP